MDRSVRDAHGDKYRWLAKVKMKYDRGNFLRLNPNVESANGSRR
jgi:hypothetical protein